MKLDELPPELLIKIFRYLSTYNKVSLVNHKFYEVACEINDRNVTLTLDRALLDLAGNTLQSIEKSNRKISKVEISLHCLTEEDFFTLLSIISRISATIKYLRIEGDYIGMVFFIKILSLVPNAEHLSFRGLHLLYADEVSSNEDLNLKHLRILELLCCGELFQVLFNRLPSGVITELQLQGNNLLNLDPFFRRQTNIKKLSLVSCTSDAQFIAHILNNLELESLEIKNSVIKTASMSKQKKLKSLTMTESYVVDKHLMEVVANSFTQLEKLNWAIRKTPVIDFVNIERLKNLKHLRLDVCHFRQDIIDALIELDNSRIVTLEISGIATNDQIQTLATSVPKLKVLNIHGYLRCEQSTAVVKHFNFVECLSFMFTGDYENYLNQSESVNAKLVELCFSIYQYKRSVLRKMIADFPNLKKLKIWAYNLTSLHFRLILNGFEKLESLDLSHCEHITTDDFKYLRDHRKSLQTLWLGKISVAYVDRNLKDLEAMFEVVKYSRRCLSLFLKM